MKPRLGLVIVMVLALCLFVGPLSAHASSLPKHTVNTHSAVHTPHTPTTSSCWIYHDEANCDYTSPYDTGCSSNSFNATSVPIKNGNTTLGTLYLRASGPCQTNWAKVITNPSVGNATIITEVVTQDGRYTYDTDYNVSSAYSQQLWTYTMPAYAHGCINGYCADTNWY